MLQYYSNSVENVFQTSNIMFWAFILYIKIWSSLYGE